jgi:hypothetical protein
MVDIELMKQFVDLAMVHCLESFSISTARGIRSAH